MQQSAINERVQPCLLDRLIDKSPADRHESRQQLGMDISKYRECVRRDISNLFNSHARLTPDECDSHPLAAASVLNYGIRDLCGVCLSSLEFGELERHLAATLRVFEPRLNPHTLSVKTVLSDGNRSSPTAIVFEVRGDLWAHPQPEHWSCKTEIDLESGFAAVGS